MPYVWRQGAHVAAVLQNTVEYTTEYASTVYMCRYTMCYGDVYVWQVEINIHNVSHVNMHGNNVTNNLNWFVFALVHQPSADGSPPLMTSWSLVVRGVVGSPRVRVINKMVPGYSPTRCSTLWSTRDLDSSLFK